MNTGRRKIQQICAAWLIICLLAQLVYTAFPGTAFAAGSQQILYKTVRVTEKEINRALNKKKLKTEADEKYLPFEAEQKEEAAALLEELLDGAVIVKQQNLGSHTAAIVAVRLQENNAESEEITGEEENSTFSDTLSVPLPDDYTTNSAGKTNYNSINIIGNKDEDSINSEEAASPSEVKDRVNGGKNTAAQEKPEIKGNARDELDAPQVSDIFMIGLNGNRDKDCVFFLEIESEGSICIEQATVCSYSALSEAFGPGVATDSDAERDETQDGGENTTENGNAGTDGTGAGNQTGSGIDGTISGNGTATKSTPSHAAYRLSRAKSATVSDAPSEEAEAAMTEDVLPFREVGLRELDEEELSALVTNKAETQAAKKAKRLEKKVNDKKERKNSFLDFLFGKDKEDESELKADSRTASSSTADRTDEDCKNRNADGNQSGNNKDSGEAADNEDSTKQEAAETQQLPAMLAEALGISVLDAKNNAGNRLYFVNMYDPAIAPESLYTGTGHEPIQYTQVEAFFAAELDGKTETSENGASDGLNHVSSERLDELEAEQTPDFKKTVMGYYDDGVFQTAVPKHEEGSEPYQYVTFRVSYYENTLLDDGSSRQEPKTHAIGIWYHFAQETEDPQTGTDFTFEPVNMDCFYYSAYQDEAKLPLCFWSAHPKRNPELLDGKWLYVDAGSMTKDFLPVADSGKAEIWLRYQRPGSGKPKSVEWKINKVAGDENTGTLYIQIPDSAGIHENDLLQFVIKQRDSSRKATAEYLIPFLYLQNGAGNLLRLDALRSRNHDGGTCQEPESHWPYNYLWGSYQAGDRSNYLMFSNTLTRFDVTTNDGTFDNTKEQMVALVWVAADDKAAGEENFKGRPQELTSQEAWDTGKIQNEEAFIAMLKQAAETSESEPLEEQYIYVAPMRQSREGVTEADNWRKIKNALGIRYPEAFSKYKTEEGYHLHVRFIHWDKNWEKIEEIGELPKPEDNSSSADGTYSFPNWSDTQQKEVLRKIANATEKSLNTDTDKKEYNSDKTIYNMSRILTVSNDYQYPCFFAARGHHTEPMNGKWDSVFAVNTLGDDSANIPEGEFKEEPNVYYGTANIYDYYSDYEMTGNAREPLLRREKDPEVGEPDKPENWVINPYPATKEAEWDVIGRDKSNPYVYQGNLTNTLIGNYYKEKGEKDTKTYYPLYFNDQAATNGDYYPSDISKNDHRNNWGPDNIIQGVMAQRLNTEKNENGALMLQSGSGNDVTNRGKEEKAVYFDEAFLRGENSENLAVGNVYNDVAFPFQLEEGMWTFDSSDPEQALRLKKDITTGTYYMDQSAVNAVKVQHATEPEYQFFPFNNPAPGFKDGVYSAFDGYYAGQNHGGDNSNSNYWQYGLGSSNAMLGLRMDIPFTLTKNGRIDMKIDDEMKEQQAITWTFTGDDDVWVYIDGVLAVELSGIHNRSGAKINFDNKTITYGTVDTNGVISGNSIKSIPFSADILNALGVKDSDAQNQEYDTKQHTLSLFYMERGLYASNLKLQFNFKVENTFTVDNQVDFSNIEEAVEKKEMNADFKQALNGMNGFDFTLMNAVTDGISKSVEEATGYIKSGASVPFHQSELTENSFGPAKKAENDLGAYELTETTGHDGSENQKKVIRAWSWGTTNSNETPPESRILNIYPTDAAGKQIKLDWDSLLVDETDADGKPITDENGETKKRKLKADFLSFWIYQSSAEQSPFGSALYVGLLDSSGNKVGGWADTLNYGNYSNAIQRGNWNKLRISKEKLEQTAGPNVFNWNEIIALQLCYYNETVYMADDVQLCEAPDTSKLTEQFSVDDADISDYDSIGTDGVNSHLSPAEGAWYNTTDNPAVVGEDGQFSLGINEQAEFINKFRVGSYLSVRMNALPDRVFSTNWTLMEGRLKQYIANDKDEDGEKAAQTADAVEVRPSWLAALPEDTAAAGAENLPVMKKDGQTLLNPKNVPGRAPYDGREEVLGLDNYPHSISSVSLKHPNDPEGSGDANTILYRSFQEPGNTRTGFHIGVRFVTTVETAYIEIEKVLSKDLLEQIKAEGTPQPRTYHFAIVYDDLAYLGLESGLQKNVVVDGVDITFTKEELQEAIDGGTAAKSAERRALPAGTHYRIYELDKPLDADGSADGGDAANADTIINDIINANEPQLAGADYETKRAFAYRVLQLDNIRNHAANTITKLTPSDSNHTGVQVYSGGNTASGGMWEHAQGWAYSISEDGTDRGTGATQVFTFTNGPAPKTGEGSVRLTKYAVDENASQGKPSFGIIGTDGGNAPEGESELSGATFELYMTAPEQQMIRRYITNNDGEILVENLPQGHYYFKEVTPPEGYQLNPNRIEFEITAEHEANPGQIPSVDIWVTDKKIVYPYGAVELTKIDSQNKAVFLKGAVFDLYKADDEAWKNADIKPGSRRTNTPSDFADLVKKNAFERYQTGYTTEEVTHTDGEIWNLRISQLPEGAYYLKEVQAPDGYLLNPEPLYFEIYVGKKAETFAVHTENTQEETAGELNKDKVLIEITFENSRQPELPKTGGPGILRYYQYGLSLIGAAYILCIREKRRKKRAVRR